MRYDGVPRDDRRRVRLSGFIHTDDGALVIGQPHVAATWFPVNDHPSDKAAYTFEITVPRGLEAVANGVLEDARERSAAGRPGPGTRRSRWRRYLATATIGEFDLRAYRDGGIRYWDAIDPDLFDPSAEPRDRRRSSPSRRPAEPSYKRLTRTISVPAGGATLSFWVDRDTEPNWDFVFVEAHTVGAGRLDDAARRERAHEPGHRASRARSGSGCTRSSSTTRPTTATTTARRRAHGRLVGGERRERRAASSGRSTCRAYAGGDVEVSITYASDDIVQPPGVFVDDIVVSTGAGHDVVRGRRRHARRLDGARAPRPAARRTTTTGSSGTAADTPPPLGETVDESFARQPEIIDFESSMLRPLPVLGGRRDRRRRSTIGFALENQTRPIYSQGFFTDPRPATAWSCTSSPTSGSATASPCARWQHIWLNEGFATYAEWLWSEREGFGTAQENFDFFYSAIPRGRSVLVA